EIFHQSKKFRPVNLSSHRMPKLTDDTKEAALGVTSNRRSKKQHSP
ncbi:hypothetical protein SSYM_2064, partial [Serratia symbiotica str. Tucson]